MEKGFTAELKNDDSWMMPRLHFHDYLEVLVSLSDAGDFFVNGSRYPIKRGTIMLLNHGELHRSITAASPYIRYVVHIEPEQVRRVYGNKTDLLCCFSKDHRYANLTEDSLKTCIELLEACRRPHEKFGDELRSKIAFAQFMLYLCEALEDDSSIAPSPPANFKRMEPVVSYIREHLEEPLSLDMLSNKFYINKHYLCHLFKEATGFSIGEYIINNRVLRSKSLLRRGRSVQRAGEEAGFRNNAHFIRTFRSLTGVPPGVYSRDYSHKNL